ncbi:ribonuclease P protein component [Nakamurella flavida]|uniref:Ribonuclease P protein component n=1 Tax=Nakamurella flavida TaxID=363630 RepID=A0A938YIX8_9ACTN|nr:ribonuclease P protein component [Nakamurella flavida]MBM9476812.1 ribonuclease P protein component [Nakamurella flavida]MDP9778747.1 ribonuclease P protein component [Nakamurella flavida]
MLPSPSRLHTAAQFSAVMRGGRRVGSRSLVVHLLSRPASSIGDATPSGAVVAGPARGGFVVSGKIGNAVVRHRITRRLRPVLREELGSLPAGTDVVVRALAPAATVESAELRDDLRSAVRAAARKAGIARTSVR